MDIRELELEIYARRNRLVEYYRRKGMSEDAEDLASRVMVKAVEKASALREPDKLDGWLRTIAINERRDFYRQKNKRREIQRYALVNVVTGQETDLLETMADDNTVEKLFQQMEHTRDVMRLLNTLSETERAVFILHVAEEHTLKRIADDMGINENTVRSIYRRSRIKLMKSYKEIFGEENHD